MSPAPPFRSIIQRMDDALALAAETGRAPVALVLGKEDHAAFQAWAQEFGIDAPTDAYRGVRVRAAAGFLSRLELSSKLGAPNALLL